MQKKKNLILLILLIILIIITSGVVYTFESSKGLSREERMFAIDEIEKVDQIEISFKGEKNVLKKQNDHWIINGKYEVDDDLSAVLMAVMQEVKTSRQVARQENDSIKQVINSSGAHVKVFSNGELINSFAAGGNDERNTSYFLKEGSDVVYIVGIPGYNSYVSGIFEISEDNWRQKEVFNSDWSSINNINVEYPQFPGKSFEVQSKGGNISIPGIQYLDTIKLSDYMDLFRTFKADYYLQNGENPDYDKLIDGTPDAIISLEDMDTSRNNILQIYAGIQDDPYWPGVFENGQLALFHQNKIKQLLVEKSSFEKKK